MSLITPGIPSSHLSLENANQAYRTLPRGHYFVNISTEKQTEGGTVDRVRWYFHDRHGKGSCSFLNIREACRRLPNETQGLSPIDPTTLITKIDKSKREDVGIDEIYDEPTISEIFSECFGWIRQCFDSIKQD